MKKLIGHPITKTLIVIFLVMFIITLLAEVCFSQEKIQPDKYYHAGAGMLISSSVYTLSQFSKREVSPYLPVVASFSAGFVKESIDACKGREFSGKDLLWTTASGIVTNLLFRVIWKDRKGRGVILKKNRKINFEKDFIIAK